MNEQEILDMYFNQDLSTYVIAEKFNTYPNKIRRIIKKNGGEMKGRDEAQRAALESGRTTHPTKGKSRDESVKLRISEGVHNKWKNLSEEDREKRIDKHRQRWYNMSEVERENLRKFAAEAVRLAAKNGSKIEQFLYAELPRYGYDIIFHKTGLIPNENLEIDLFVPSINTAIEIDGPAHFLAIWGDENLQRHMKSDIHKSGLLLQGGFVIIRIKHLAKSVSEKNKRDILKMVLENLDRIKEKFPDKHDRYIELEVN